MKRLVGLAVAAILLVGAGTIAVILLVSGDGGGMVDWFTPSAPPAPPPLYRTPEEITRSGTVPTAQPPPVSLPAEPVPAPAADSWEAVTPVARVNVLRGLGPALGRELNELRPRLEACFDEETQARHGQVPFTSVRDLQPIGDQGIAVLLLQIETQPGRVVIVDAPLEARGDASDGLVACAQQVLRGLAVDVPSAKGGERHRARFPLQP